MKKLITLCLVAIMTLSLGSCASGRTKDVQVKCPACGYEFLSPHDGNLRDK